jgi:PAS domain S-box-containing protein
MDESFRVLSEEGDPFLCRGSRVGADGSRMTVLALLVTAEHPPPFILDRLAREYELKDELDGAWAARPLEFVREHGRTMLILEDPGGEPLARLVGAPMEPGRFLHFAVGVAAALSKAHQRGLVHKDLKPAHVLVNCADGEVRLTGFGVASRLPRERQTPEPPELIAGTLAYMAPEQTGRMNRSIDSRSDLYSLGVTFYQMLTGVLPFAASDPLEWVHCHIARQPLAPSERAETVPAPVSEIIMKLLAKTAEERYQTAAGVERDLMRCLTEWEAHGRVAGFPLGRHDTPDRLMIPEKLYGRAREVETLLASFDRIVKSSAPELVLVSGYSGIGKSSVVNELHKALVSPRGLFASGKFDQYKRDIPYSTLVQAFQGLLRPLLGKSDAELAIWRDAFLEALEPNAPLITDLIPELKLIIGDQPPLPELEPQHAQSRFRLAFRRFIGVFARPEHPLALFLDDLQWLDPATLDLMEGLLTRSDVQHLMVIGAYRDNEVDAAHPLARKLDVMRRAGARVHEIRLAPLTPDDLGQLIADALRCERPDVARLARLVHDKTAGNPFFAIQFLHALAEERLLHFDHGAARWTWDLDRIHAKGYTDNVVALMIGKLTRLPVETQRTLHEFACLGNVAATAMLPIVLGIPEEQVHAALWPAVRLGLVERLEGSYKFMHDRVQEAAYSLIPQALRAEVHLRIGRLYAARTPPEEREEAIFEIVSQLNRGAALIADQEERDQLAELDLIAGKRAKGSAAYASALAYLNAGVALLSEDAWERRHELVFALEINRAECEFLTGDLAAAEERLNGLSIRAATTLERASVAYLRLDLYIMLGQSSRAVAVGLEYLRHLGIEWSPHPADEDMRREYERIWSTLAGRPIEALIEAPLMSDQASLATLDVLTKLAAPAWYTDANLASLIICRVVNLSLEGGACDGSCYAYVVLGLIAGARFGDYASGFRFGRLGHDLAEQRGLKRFQARTHLIFGSAVMPWTQHIRAGRALISGAFEAANKIGDRTFAGYCCNHLNTHLFAAGDSLEEVQREAERGLAFAQRIRFGLVKDSIAAQLALVRTLRGLTPNFGRLDDDEFTELGMERRFSDNPDLAGAEGMYWIRKLQARVFAGDYAAAHEASERAQRIIWTRPSHFETAEYEFYGALSRAGLCESAAAGERRLHVEALAAHCRQLEVWAENCPENFDNRAALAGAELARIEGRDSDAMRLYEEAIHSARDHGFVNNEAIAYERASDFYRARGFGEIADLYLRNARYGYLRWGADGKVRRLEAIYPQLTTGEPSASPTSTIATPVERLDLATVIKVSQTVSGEMVLEKLIEALMRTAIAQAGAERGLLILSRGAEPRIAAEARTGGDAVHVKLSDLPANAAVLPETVLHTVLRTRESVILDDAASDPSCAADPYIRRRQARSILCLPLINQGKLIGVIYLENNLTPGAFAPARIAVLKLLASQAAVSLENTRLYRDLEQREAKIRRLVDANIIGIYVWDSEGRIIEGNDAFLQIVGYERDDLAAGRLDRDGLTPPEWRDRTARGAAELRMTGTILPFEKEYIRKDGSRVPVLLGAAGFDETANEGVTFVVDLTERKQAEAEARESERRYRELQGEFAHANRVATMGQLTASIAHEVNQPIAAAVTNANAGLRWLSAGRPDLEEARQAFRRVLENGNRAGEVIGRIRALVKKAPARKDSVAINEAILEVVALTHGEAAKNGVSVSTLLAEGLPAIEGDRVQLQQVILNLIVNAIEAMSGASGDTPRQLLVTSERAEPDGVMVAVKDSGPGLAPATLDRLFDAFYTTKADGMGMGLSICRSIIEAHGGRLRASPNHPRGAVFEFTVPADAGG